MAEAESIRATGAVNPDTFVADLLEFADAGVSVRARPDLGAVELVVRSGSDPDWVVVLGVNQTLALRDRLLAAAVESACGWAEGRP